MTQACMGGWCGDRAACPHYHATDRREPAERLCEPGETLVRQHRAAGTWERISVPSMLRAADPFDGIGDVAALSPDVARGRHL